MDTFVKDSKSARRCSTIKPEKFQSWLSDLECIFVNVPHIYTIPKQIQMLHCCCMKYSNVTCQHVKSVTSVTCQHVENVLHLSHLQPSNLQPDELILEMECFLFQFKTNFHFLHILGHNWIVMGLMDLPALVSSGLTDLEFISCRISNSLWTPRVKHSRLLWLY